MRDVTVNTADALCKALLPNSVLNQISAHTSACLRAIRTELHEIREGQREQRGRLGSIERSISYMTREIAEMGLRLDRMHDRLDRIERRLDLAET